MAQKWVASPTLMLQVFAILLDDAGRNGGGEPWKPVITLSLTQHSHTAQLTSFPARGLLYLVLCSFLSNGQTLMGSSCLNHLCLQRNTWYIFVKWMSEGIVVEKKTHHKFRSISQVSTMCESLLIETSAVKSA